jgi:hypothetical protein
VSGDSIESSVDLYGRLIVETAVMAKAKAKPKAASAPSRADRPAIAVTLRGGPAWKEWVEGLADHCRLDVAKVIDQALVEYAKGKGYAREAPRR